MFGENSQIIPESVVSKLTDAERSDLVRCLFNLYNEMHAKSYGQGWGDGWAAAQNQNFTTDFAAQKLSGKERWQ